MKVYILVEADAEYEFLKTIKSVHETYESACIPLREITEDPERYSIQEWNVKK